jgi:hypothetical protein
MGMGMGMPVVLQAPDQPPPPPGEPPAGGGEFIPPPPPIGGVYGMPAMAMGMPPAVGGCVQVEPSFTPIA